MTEQALQDVEEGWMLYESQGQRLVHAPRR